MRTSGVRLILACTVVLPVLVLGTTSGASADEPNTPELMRSVHDAIAYLLPLSVRAPDEDSVWDDELIDAKLRVLDDAAARLAEHAEQQDPEFRLLARSFEQLSRDVVESFNKEWPDFAWFSLMELTDHCVSCHSRQPGVSRSMPGQRLMARMDLNAVDDNDRVTLYIATRQFDAALDNLEKLMLDERIDPTRHDYRGWPLRYLKTAVTTGDNRARLADFLTRYKARDDMPPYLAARVERWLTALKTHGALLEQETDLATTIALFDSATANARIPGDRGVAVEDMIAARLLRKHLAANAALDAPTRADILFRLGLIALRTTEPEPSVPDMEILLMAAIQADPGGARARDAYLLLEEHGYVHEEHLARQLESRTLIDMARLREMAGF